MKTKTLTRDEGLSVQDVAIRFHTSATTIYRWIKSGKLNIKMRPGFDVGARVTLESIEALEKGSAL